MDCWLLLIFDGFRHATKLKSIFYMQLQKKERSPQQKIQYGRRSVPRLHSWTRFSGHEWKSFVLHHKYRGRRRYACVNIQETCYQRKSDLDSIALAGPGLFVFYMYVVFLCRVEGGHWHHIDDFDNERESDQWPCRLYGLQKVWQLIPPFLSLLAVFFHMFSHLVPKTIDFELKTWNIFKNLYVCSYCHVYTHVLVFTSI